MESEVLIGIEVQLKINKRGIGKEWTEKLQKKQGRKQELQHNTSDFLYEGAFIKDDFATTALFWLKYLSVLYYIIIVFF